MLTTSVQPAISAKKDSFYTLMQSKEIRNALIACYGEQVNATVEDQPGLLNLLKDQDLTLALGYAIYLHAWWQNENQAF